MITVTTKKSTMSFNLKTGFPREIDLCQTITRLQGENSRATVNINTSDEPLSLKISDVVKTSFKEAEYIKAKVHTGRIDDPPRVKDEDTINKIMTRMEERKKGQLGKFFDALRKQGINPEDLAERL